MDRRQRISGRGPLISWPAGLDFFFDEPSIDLDHWKLKCMEQCRRTWSRSPRKLSKSRSQHFLSSGVGASTTNKEKIWRLFGILIYSPIPFEGCGIDLENTRLNGKAYCYGEYTQNSDLSALDTTLSTIANTIIVHPLTPLVVGRPLQHLVQGTSLWCYLGILILFLVFCGFPDGLIST